MILLLPYTFIQLCHHISQISFVLQQIEFYEFPGGRRTTLFHTFCIFVNSEFCTYFHKSIFAYLFWYVNVIVNLKHLSYFWKIHISTTRGPTAVWTRIEMCRDFFVKASLTFFWTNYSSNLESNGWEGLSVVPSGHLSVILVVISGFRQWVLDPYTKQLWTPTNTIRCRKRCHCLNCLQWLQIEQKNEHKLKRLKLHFSDTAAPLHFELRLFPN